MTDHTPSPATDGLRARLTALVTEHRSLTAAPEGTMEHRLLGRLDALLADPAPEAAREFDCGTCGAESPVQCPSPGNCTPADLPVATGVTAEDEGRMVLGVVGETRWNHYVRRGRGDFTPCFCAATSDHQIGDEVSPAPAPVVSAGDEGGLSEEEREALAELLRKTWLNDAPGDAWDKASDHSRREWLRFAEAILASDWLAARVAEAGARALREAADHAKRWDASSSTPEKPYDHGVRVGMRLVEKSLRDRAEQIGGDQ